MKSIWHPERHCHNMKFAVSACLLGVNCKYNGGNNLHVDLQSFLKDHQVLPVCPEMLGGLPSPRACCECFQGAVITEHGDDVTDAFIQGAKLALDQIKDFHPSAVILQPRSPSCGNNQIYSGHFDGTLISGQGIFAHMLQEAGIPSFDVDDFMCQVLENKILEKSS